MYALGTSQFKIFIRVVARENSIQTAYPNKTQFNVERSAPHFRIQIRNLQNSLFWRTPCDRDMILMSSSSEINYIVEIRAKYKQRWTFFSGEYFIRNSYSTITDEAKVISNLHICIFEVQITRSLRIFYWSTELRISLEEFNCWRHLFIDILLISQLVPIRSYTLFLTTLNFCKLVFR